MNSDREEAVRARAYQLWKESGEMYGNHDKHWRQAEREIGGAPDADDIENVTSIGDSHADHGTSSRAEPAERAGPHHIVPEPETGR